jgi:enterochelin esterase family protein
MAKNIPLLIPGAVETGTVSPSAPASLRIDARVDDYIKGAIDAGRGRLNLDIVQEDGAHVRRLLDNISGRAEFQFVAGEPGWLLKVSGPDEAQGFEVTLLQQVSLVDQVPPAEEFLSPTIAAVAQEIAKGGSSTPFWAMVEAEGTPLIEPGPDGQVIATFLWRGAKRNVRLFGGPSGDHENLQRIGGSDIWFKSYALPDDARLAYQLAPDVPDVPGTARERRVAILATAQQDPLNRHPWPENGMDRFERDSVLALPKAPPQPFLAEKGRAKGVLTQLTITSAALGNSRDITLYRPAGFDPANRDNLLLFVFDAAEYLTKVPTPLILDNMIAEGVIPPTVAVFVANPDRESRGRELPANPDFADFMARELLPKILSETGLAGDPARTILAGSSYGGLASTSVALAHPESFGNVLSMSGSYWWSPPGTPQDRQNHIAAEVAAGPSPNVRFFLSAGLFETGASRGVGSIIETNRHLRDVLLARKSQVYYREYAGGHDYLIWRGAIADGLVALFGKD